MNVVKIKELTLGVVLSKDIKDVNGRLLLKASTVIEEKQLKILRAWGVTEVSVLNGGRVESEDEVNLDEIDPAIREQVDQELDELFRYTDKGHEVINELIQLTRIKLIKNYQQGNEA